MSQYAETRAVPSDHGWPAYERCVCGQPATVAVVVHWKNGDRTYHYCPACALDVCVMSGVEPAQFDGTPDA